MAQFVDLKKLLILINDNKDVPANLILDEGCTFETEDPKPLIKVLNYLINYLNQFASRPLEISLDLRSADYLMSLMVYTDTAEFPPVSDQIGGALQDYRAKLEKVHEPGKYLQFKISFQR
jgi:hypothetical protein